MVCHTFGNMKANHPAAIHNVSGASKLPKNTLMTTKDSKIWLVTGTFHGSVVYAASEGDARRAFHARYGGESIIHIRREPQ